MTGVNHRFALYVLGRDQRSERATAALRTLCEERIGRGRYRIEVIDVADHPDRAEADRVVATPTIVRLAPAPRRQVVGDLSSPAEIARALGFASTGDDAGSPRRED